MKASIKGNILTIEIEINAKPVLSASGKSRIVATSGGNQTMPIEVDGKPLVIGLNAYIKA
jgi:hypothetical protein